MGHLECSGDTKEMAPRRSPPAEERYVLVVGEDAAELAELEGATVLRYVPNVLLMRIDAVRATAFARECRFVRVYESRADAMRAFRLFVPRDR
jgi:hypothetical protein